MYSWGAEIFAVETRCGHRMLNSSIIRREEIASLCIALLEEPSAVYTTFEIRSTVPFSQPFIADSQATQQVRDWSTLLKAAKLDPKITGKLEDKKLVVA